MLRAGRAALPLLIEAEPLTPDDPDAVFVHPKADDEGRIAFEHLLSFASWVVAEPENVERPLRIGRYGMGFLERQRVEMAEYIELSEPQLQQLGWGRPSTGARLRPRPAHKNCVASSTRNSRPASRC